MLTTLLLIMHPKELKPRMICLFASNSNPTKKWFDEKPVMIERVITTPYNDSVAVDLVGEHGESKNVDVTTAVASLWDGTVTFSNGKASFSPKVKQTHSTPDVFPMTYSHSFRVDAPSKTSYNDSQTRAFRIYTKASDVAVFFDIFTSAVSAFNATTNRCKQRVASVDNITTQPWPHQLCCSNKILPKLMNTIGVDRGTDDECKFLPKLMDNLTLYVGDILFVPVSDVTYTEATKPKIIGTIAVHRIL